VPALGEGTAGLKEMPHELEPVRPRQLDPLRVGRPVAGVLGLRLQSIYAAAAQERTARRHWDTIADTLLWPATGSRLPTGRRAPETDRTMPRRRLRVSRRGTG
jgi:hypothetical protein